MKGNFLAIGLGMLLLATAAKGPLDVHAKPRFQIVSITVSERGFEPAAFKLRRGIPARLIFRRTTEATCGKEIAIPDFNIKRALPLNERVVVTFTPTKRGTFSFVCGMNMMRGELIVQ